MPSRRGFVELKAGPDDEGRRLDRVLRVILGAVPLSAVYSALRRGRILVNGSPSEAAYRVREGDRLSVDPRLMPGEAGPREPRGRPAASRAAGAGELSSLIVLETEDLLFINKPRGLLVHGEGSLEERVRAYLAERSGESLSFVPGPLHRLDRNTTGLVAFPRSSAGARAFSAILRERKVEKRYLALLDGRLEAAEAWEDRLARDSERRVSAAGELGGRASSDARPLAIAGGYSLVLVEIHTGLTHQIRAQAAARAMPLAGDSKYGGSPLAGGYILHALELRFPEPPFPDLPERVVAPLPPSALERLGGIFGAAALKEALGSAVFG